MGESAPRQDIGLDLGACMTARIPTYCIRGMKSVEPKHNDLLDESTLIATCTSACGYRPSDWNLYQITDETRRSDRASGAYLHHKREFSFTPELF